MKKRTGPAERVLRALWTQDQPGYVWPKITWGFKKDELLAIIRAALRPAPARRRRRKL